MRANAHEKNKGEKSRSRTNEGENEGEDERKEKKSDGEGGGAEDGQKRKSEGAATLLYLDYADCDSLCLALRRTPPGSRLHAHGYAGPFPPV